MTDLRTEDWQRIDRLFAAAMELPDAEREAFLVESGAPDEILARVRRLLSVEPSAEQNIGESVRSLASEVIDTLTQAPADDLPPGAAVGPYRVVRELGRGGMGTVYLAERSDETYDRQVALKVVKRGMDTDEIVARFRREGRILTRLEHPSIGRMYDADVTPDGRPYLVLEYIDGQPIDVFCDAKRMTVEERLRLFTQVCDAVSYAHNKLVLHRDLKPSNILVSEDGPTLLDFGVAKVLDEDGGETGDLTALMGRRLTPEYASPEQLSGGAISTTSDVYALAVVLHELLTGARPSVDGTRAPSAGVTGGTDTEGAMQTATFRRSTPERLARLLQGDLDVILMMALHPEAERRYASVEAFAADLRRHLAGRPVTARPDSVAYRARKFVSRNRFPVLSGSGIGVSVVFFAIASFLQQAETAQERDRADLERVRAEEVAAALEEMFSGAGFDSRDRIDTLRVRQLLDRNATRVMDQLDDRPVVQGTLLRVFGTAQHAIGRLEEADSLLSRSVAVLSAAAAADPRPLLRAQLELGNLRMRQGRWADARGLYNAWLAAAAEPTPDEVAMLQHNLGLTMLFGGQVDSAAAKLDSSLTIHRADPTMNPVGFGESLTMRAGVAQRTGDLALARDLSEEALDVMTSALGPDHPSVMMTEHNRAFIIYRSGSPAEAEPLFADLVERYRRLVGASAEVSALLQNYGNVLRDLGRPEEALELIREAVELDRSGDAARLSNALDALGTTLEALGRTDEAVVAFEEAQRVARTLFGEEHPSTAISLLKVASALCNNDAPDESDVLERFQVAESTLARVLPPNHPSIPDARLRRGRCLLGLGRGEDARDALEEAVAGFEALGGPAPALASARELLSQLAGGGG